MSSEEKIIELTELEQLFVHFNRAGDCMTMSSAFLGTSSDLKPEDLMAALKIIQSRHPFLRAYLIIDNEKMYLKIIARENESSKNIQLDWVETENLSRDDAIEKASAFNCKYFQTSEHELLWRIQVIKFNNNKTQLMINFVASGTITDGLNICTLLVELVNILNALAQNIECDEMKTKLEPMANLHTLCESRNLFNEKKHLKKVEEIGTKMSDPTNRKFLFDDKFKSDNEIGFKLDLFRIDESTTEKILRISKSNNIRLTAYFQTLLLYAVKKLYDENEIELPELDRTLKMQFPISFRIRYEPLLELYQCGSHVTIASYSPDASLFSTFDNFWQDCKHVNELIRENTSVDSGALFSLTHNPHLFSGVGESFRQAASLADACQREHENLFCDISQSNLGTYLNDNSKVLSGGPFDIEEIYCSDSQQSIPNIHCGFVMHTLYWRGQIMVQFGANKWCFGTRYFQQTKRIVS